MMEFLGQIKKLWLNRESGKLFRFCTNPDSLAHAGPEVQLEAHVKSDDCINGARAFGADSFS